MTRFENVLKRFPLYVLLLGVYPVLFLWLANFGKVHSYVVPRSLLISFGFTAVVFLLIWIFIHPIRKAGLAAGFLLLLFFSYGHLFSLIDNASLSGLIIGRHRFLIPLWGLIALVGTYLIIKSRSDLYESTRIINLISFLLTAFVLIQIGFAASTSTRLQQNSVQSGPSASSSSSLHTSANTNRDVYYILMDGYDRADLLKRDLNLDIQPFLDQLTQMGFVIPDCGQSNYIDTALSMAATFNMDYLDNLGLSYEDLATKDHEKILTPFITHSLVRQKFSEMGYKIVTYKSPYLFIDMPDSDVYLDGETAVNPGEKMETLNFQQLFINTTFARTAAEWLVENPQDSKNIPAFFVWLINPGSLNPDSSSFVGRNYKQFRQNNFQLDSLETIPDMPGRKFVYAHLLITHQPFTFLPTGEFRTDPKDSYLGYIDQVKYLNTRIIKIIKTIQHKSAVPPVIIPQSDHSFSDNGKRALNFQAYYLPDSGNTVIPPSFTNVNTFRLIFDTYFDGHYSLIPDQSMLIDKNIPGFTKLIKSSCMSD